MTILLELGHSRAKLGETVDYGQVAEIASISIEEESALSESLSALHATAGGKALLALNGSGNEALQRLVEDAYGEVVWAGREMAGRGIQSHYTTPKVFGIDRLFALQGARRRTDTSVIVVDAGTAVTVDGLTPNGEHCGGWIVPGYRLQLAAMGFLSGVPAADEEHETPTPNQTRNTGTAEAVLAGIWRELAGGVDAMCAQLIGLELGESTHVYFTGGDGGTLMEWSGTRPASNVPTLVLEGLSACGQLTP